MWAYQMTELIVNAMILVGSLFLLGLVSDRVIRYVTALSEIFGMSEMAAGFILLSISTSLPELSVSIIASLIGEGGLSLGNVLGSNVANLTVIMGLAIVLSKAKVTIEEESQKELVQFLFLSSVIPLFVVQRGSLSLALGVILLILFAYFTVTVSKKAPKTQSLQPVSNMDKVMVTAKFAISVLVIIAISKFTVDSGVAIATIAGVPPSVIGATIVGLGTSLPELATTIQALRAGMSNMALGNLIGSCITNITLILGTSSLITCCEVNVTSVGGLMFFVLLSTLYVWYILGTRKNIEKRVAYFLIAIYCAFILQELGFSLFIF